MYDQIGRNYDFGVDHWTIAEEFGFLSEDYHHERTVSVTETTRVGGQEITTAETHTTSESIKTPHKGKAKAATKEANTGEDEPGGYKTEFTVDAFYYGNWTRFCNHRCNTSNAAPRPVYIDDIDPRRPLLVFFATKDIQVSQIKRRASGVALERAWAERGWLNVAWGRDHDRVPGQAQRVGPGRHEAKRCGPPHSPRRRQAKAGS